MIGVVVLTVLANGLILAGVSPYVQQAVQGVVVVLAVAAADLVGLLASADHDRIRARDSLRSDPLEALRLANESLALNADSVPALAPPRCVPTGSVIATQPQRAARRRKARSSSSPYMKMFVSNVPTSSSAARR